MACELHLKWFSICLLLMLGLIHPYFALTGFIIFSIWVPKAIDNTYSLIVLSLNIALLISTRSIPAFPADDLSAYWLYYNSLFNLNFIDIIFEFRYEPVLYWIFKYIYPSLSEPRELLFFNSWLVSFFMSFALLYCFKGGSKSGLLALFIVIFPYSIVSNIPRQMLAGSIAIIAIYSIGYKRVLLSIAAVLIHKSILPIILFPLIPIKHRWRALNIVLVIVIIVLSPYFLDFIISSSLGGRMTSFTYRDGTGKLFTLFTLSIVFFYYVISREKFYLLFTYWLIFALTATNYGPLGIRLTYSLYIPIVLACYYIFDSFDMILPNYLKRVLFTYFCLTVLFLRLVYSPGVNTHDPFSMLGFEDLFFMGLL